MAISLVKQFKYAISKKLDKQELADAIPELGFRIIYDCENLLLKVKIIGARSLPTVYGNIKPCGYFAKVKVFPNQTKYETEVHKDSSPSFNQEFQFPFNENLTNQFTGKFVVITVYAILDAKTYHSRNVKRKSSFKNQFREFLGEKPLAREEYRKKNSGNRTSLQNYRTVGAITYNLEAKIFTQILKNKSMATLDLWRPLQEISSGRQIESKESKKGSVELTMCYSNSEDGNNDIIEVGLSKFRCSMQTMQSHEKLTGNLYIKMNTFEQDEKISRWKSENFEPTISMKIEAKTATMQAIVHDFNLRYIRVLIRLIAQNVFGKKTLLGKIEINVNSDMYKDILNAPNIPFTKMLDFE